MHLAGTGRDFDAIADTDGERHCDIINGADAWHRQPQSHADPDAESHADPDAESHADPDTVARAHAPADIHRAAG